MITERELDRAEEAFPGIVRFFESLDRKPVTFLHLVSLFEHWGEGDGAAAAPRGSGRSPSAPVQ